MNSASRFSLLRWNRECRLQSEIENSFARHAKLLAPGEDLNRCTCSAADGVPAGAPLPAAATAPIISRQPKLQLRLPLDFVRGVKLFKLTVSVGTFGRNHDVIDSQIVFQADVKLIADLICPKVHTVDHANFKHGAGGDGDH